MAAEEGKVDPMKQFTIEPLLGSDWQLADGFNIAFTNSALWMAITAVLVWAFVAGGMKRELVPGRWQMAVESMTGFIDDLLEANIGAAGRKYVPYIFTLFMFILFGNLLGMIPSAFTFTSHIVVTFIMALVVFVFVTILAIVKHGMRFFSFFVPPGAPKAMWPLLIPIEIISYLSRPVSLSVRLFANMLAGHTLLKVFAGFIVALGAAGVVPLFFVVALTGLEILIAFLQAYVFTILTCLYINDALHLH